MPHLLRAGLLTLAMLVLSYPGAVHAHSHGLRSVDHQARGAGRSGGAASRAGGGAQGRGSRGAGSGRSVGGGYYAGSNGWNYTDAPCGRSAYCGNSFGLLALTYSLGLPWSLPRTFDNPTLTSYAPYPFADGPGLYRPDADSSPEADQHDLRNVALAVDLESGYQIEGVVPATVAMRTLLPRRFELDSRVSLLRDVQDHLLAGAGVAHVAYRFAQGPRFDVRMGVGTRLFTLASMRWGVDLMYAMDTYLAQSLVLKVELHVGNVEHALVAQARSTLGSMVGPCELYLGYDHTGYHGSEFAALSGPVAGLRGWF
ncbi:MAG: hypothetical protein JWN04_1906 [Myxococcaceae bacterium]|nr:hypothetical protein [Myxococcaceae bacterium]